ncbi:hypothetical protein Q0M94_28635 (plasmid) [Deinococcus radiomollis]|uniref:hypothetical protein n=1 Tax=Deinococcus radiomollis TaxID=468916 RepID=UPI003892C320
MIQPSTFRFNIASAVGSGNRVVLRDASYILGSRGFRLSLSPLLACNEMTMVARNGPLPNNGAGLNLNPLDLVQVEVTEDGSTWYQVFYGELRQGGNLYDYLGENMVLRGLDVRLRETPTPDVTYPAQDAGLTVRSILHDADLAGMFGVSSNVIYPNDTTYLPLLGFNLGKLVTNQQPIGVLLDAIVTAGASAGVKVAWGVRPDKRVTFQVAPTSELAWAAEQINWKEPTSAVVTTAVTWAVAKRADTGSIIYYTSIGPGAAAYGVRTKSVQLQGGLNAYVPAVLTGTYVGATQTVTGTGTADSVIRDGDPNTFLTLSDPNIVVSATLTIPPGGADRLFIDAQTQTGIPAQFLINYPNGQTWGQRSTDTSGTGFTARSFDAAYFYSSVATLGLPAGATVKLLANPAPGSTPTSLKITEFRVESLNKSGLDAAAAAFYSTPETAPADLSKHGLLLPSDFGGKVRTPRPNGAQDYTANVSLYEYAFSNAGGVQTTVKTGEPDKPEDVARNTLIKRLASNATAAAVQASATL